MLPVTSLNSVQIGNGEVGPLYSKLLNQWSKNVGVNIELQIKNWATNSNTTGPTPYQFKK